jgi:hypothetical protein
VYEQRYEFLSTDFRSFTAILDFQHTQTLEGFRTSPTVLSDSGNVGVAVVISLLSYIQAEMNDIAYLLPVNGSHLAFTSHPLSESIKTSIIVLLEPEDVGLAVRISLLSYMQAEI